MDFTDRDLFELKLSNSMPNLSDSEGLVLIYLFHAFKYKCVFRKHIETDINQLRGVLKVIK